MWRLSFCPLTVLLALLSLTSARAETPATADTCDVTSILARRAVTVQTDQFNGSGLLLDGRHVLTARHVVLNAGWVSVTVSHNPAVQAIANVIVPSDDLDLALLELDHDLNLPAIAVSPTTPPARKTVWYSRMQGHYVESLLGDDFSDDPVYLSFPEEISVGDSGSALLSCAGELTSIATIRILKGYCGDPPLASVFCIFNYSIGIKAEFINGFLMSNWPGYGNQPTPGTPHGAKAHARHTP